MKTNPTPTNPPTETVEKWEQRVCELIPNDKQEPDKLLDYIETLIDSSLQEAKAGLIQEIEGKRKKMTKKDQVGPGENLSNDTLIKLGYNQALEDMKLAILKGET